MLILSDDADGLKLYHKMVVLACVCPGERRIENEGASSFLPFFQKKKSDCVDTNVFVNDGKSCSNVELEGGKLQASMRMK